MNGDATLMDKKPKMKIVGQEAQDEDCLHLGPHIEVCVDDREAFES